MYNYVFLDSREGIIQAIANTRNRDQMVPREECRRREEAQVVDHRRTDATVEAQVPNLPGESQGVQLPTAVQLQRPLRQPQNSNGELTQ